MEPCSLTPPPGHQSRRACPWLALHRVRPFARPTSAAARAQYGRHEARPLAAGARRGLGQSSVRHPRARTS
eukprot:scaffold240240_cov27-Tisochrysis_lutea.AAC.2